MARKNILSGLMDDTKKFTAVNSADEVASVSTRTPFSSKGIGALGAVTRSIDALAAKADAAKAMEERLASGELVVELDPNNIEQSFVADRLVQSDEQFRELLEAIRLRGQDSPILVRPHPAKNGFYQIAFGHRRVRAAKELGRSVKAVVKRLDDRDHVIAQGQENSARSDLSFIERTMFAQRLDGLGFERDVIMSALSADKTTVSKMLSVTKRIPRDILSTVEAARAVGRDRWHDLASQFEDAGVEGRIREIIGSSDFQSSSAERRFELMELATVRKVENHTAAISLSVWQNQNGAVKAKMKNDGKRFTLALHAEQASAFGAYLEENLDRLYEAFQENRKTSNGD